MRLRVRLDGYRISLNSCTRAQLGYARQLENDKTPSIERFDYPACFLAVLLACASPLTRMLRSRARYRKGLHTCFFRLLFPVSPHRAQWSELPGWGVIELHILAEHLQE